MTPQQLTRTVDIAVERISREDPQGILLPQFMHPMLEVAHKLNRWQIERLLGLENAEEYRRRVALADEERKRRLR